MIKYLARPSCCCPIAALAVAAPSPPNRCASPPRRRPYPASSPPLLSMAVAVTVVMVSQCVFLSKCYRKFSLSGKILSHFASPMLVQNGRTPHKLAASWARKERNHIGGMMYLPSGNSIATNGGGYHFATTFLRKMCLHDEEYPTSSAIGATRQGLIQITLVSSEMWTPSHAGAQPRLQTPPDTPRTLPNPLHPFPDPAEPSQTPPIHVFCSPRDPSGHVFAQFQTTNNSKNQEDKGKSNNNKCDSSLLRVIGISSSIKFNLLSSIKNKSIQIIKEIYLTFSIMHSFKFNHAVGQR